MSTLIAVAHADDECIGASRLFGPGCRILHVTDSAPRNPVFFQKHGFASREEYARARRREMLAAVKLAGMRAAQCVTLAIADQDAVLHLKRIARRVAREIDQGATVIYTHAYEGGHPDHDACALAVQAAARGRRVEVREMPYYHAARGKLEAGAFPDGGTAREPRLTREQVARKSAMFACFGSQQHVFDRFVLEREPWRRAPRHDFLRPPHPGTLYYETRPLGWTYARWREEAARFLASRENGSS